MLEYANEQYAISEESPCQERSRLSGYCATLAGYCLRFICTMAETMALVSIISSERYGGSRKVKIQTLKQGYSLFLETVFDMNLKSHNKILKLISEAL